MGLIFFCISFFIIWTIFSTFELFGEIIGLLKELVVYLTGKIRHKNNVAKSKIILEEIKTVDNNKNNDTDSYIADLRVEARVETLVDAYPYCDKELLEKYKREFLFLPELEIDKLETAIRKSHEEAIKNKEIVFEEVIKHSDLSNSNRLEVVNQYPMVMSFYKVKDTYALLIENKITTEKVAYQSKRHITLLQMCSDIYDKVEMLNSLSLNDKINFDELYNPNDYEDIAIIL